MLRLAIVAAGLFVTAATAQEKAPAIDPEKLAGEWEYVSGTKAGNKVDGIKGKVTLTKDTIGMTLNDQKFVFGYKIKDKESPSKLDLTTKESPFGANDNVVKGLVGLKDDQLSICYVFDFSGKQLDYPAKLESTAENKAHLFVLKRVKK